MAQSSNSNHRSSQAGGRYHHFIPRFILRGFVDPSAPAPGPIRLDKRGNVKPSRDGYINVIDLKTGTLEERLLSKQYGLKDMYRDERCAMPEEVEEQLSRLEARAGQIIANARKLFTKDPDGVLTLSRGERNDLRKFLFVMKYRNNTFYQRYNHDTINDYMTHDKEKMRVYMKHKGFTSPRDVWLDNLRAFLDITMDVKLHWIHEITQKTYADDATMFIEHAQTTFLAFCRPEVVTEEFLLTANAYGIFEGPSSTIVDAADGVVGTMIRTEWHNFAPVTPDLIIVLRSNLLPGGKAEQSGLSLYDRLRSSHHNPEGAGSALHDLPVKCCTPIYTDSLGNHVNAVCDPSDLSETDKFEFRCFPLPTRHVNLINAVMLEETSQTEYLTYRTKSAAIITLSTYLESEHRGFKNFWGHDDERLEGLNKLKRALHHLGAVAKVKCTIYTGPVTHMTEHVAAVVGSAVYQDRPQLLTRYLELSRGGSKNDFMYDVLQASRMLFLHIKLDAWMSRLAIRHESRLEIRRSLLNVFAQLPVQRGWLYIKCLRNLKQFHIDDFRRDPKPLQLEGAEDVVPGGLQIWATLF